MPLMERYKLENDAIVAFEAVVQESITDKEDYITALCEHLNVAAKKDMTTG
jgi:hypothetical protein